MENDTGISTLAIVAAALSACSLLASIGTLLLVLSRAPRKCDKPGCLVQHAGPPIVIKAQAKGGAHGE